MHPDVKPTDMCLSSLNVATWRQQAPPPRGLTTGAMPSVASSSAFVITSVARRRKIRLGRGLLAEVFVLPVPQRAEGNATPEDHLRARTIRKRTLLKDL